MKEGEETGRKEEGLETREEGGGDVVTTLSCDVRL